MKVRLFDGDEVIGTVPFTSNLDYWDGSNWSSGSTGRHIGVGQLTDGRWYVCYGSDWQGERDYAEVISEAEAKRLCLAHDADEYESLFGEPAPDMTNTVNDLTKRKRQVRDKFNKFDFHSNPELLNRIERLLETGGE